MNDQEEAEKLLIEAYKILSGREDTPSLEEAKALILTAASISRKTVLSYYGVSYISLDKIESA